MSNIIPLRLQSPQLVKVCTAIYRKSNFFAFSITFRVLINVTKKLVSSLNLANLSFSSFSAETFQNWFSIEQPWYIHFILSTPAQKKDAKNIGNEYTWVDPLTSILAVLARSCQILTTSWQPWIPWQDSY